ncbi:MAG: hypothetical protein EPO16_10045 [Dehalococcoidia bacterium]|nr:MAG: hypothetical protein EPO16_10045 [Dehalococcoidia bacterium]
MDQARVRWWSVAAGVLLALTGSVWALQGVGVLGGSTMSGNSTWTVIGIAVAVAGALLAWRGAARGR